MYEQLQKMERIIHIWILLYNRPFRYNARELATRFDVNVKTIYRDMDTLDVGLRVPLQKEGTRWGIDKSHYLPPLQFSIPEALTIFLAARLMLQYSHRYDPYIDAAFTRLGTVMPEPLRQQIQKTLDWMEKLPRDNHYLEVLAKLSSAWVSRNKVNISYQSFASDKAVSRIIEPYFIEPAAAGHASYVIGYCHRAGEIRSFKIERITDMDILEEKYEIPSSFDANSYFGSAWGVIVEGEARVVKLKFNKNIARIIGETLWHPSQVLERQKDGSLIATFKIMDTIELSSWILGWGERVEVLEPQDLRDFIAQTAKDMLVLYQNDKKR